MAEFPGSILENLNQSTKNFTILATNSTSGNKISRQPGDVALITLSESGVTLEVPKRSCADGHSFILQIEAIIEEAEGQKPTHLNTQVTGVIEEIVGDTSQRFQVKIEFRQYSIEDWQKFLSHVEHRQANSNKVLKEMKK